MHLKDINVTNPANVLVQIPALVARKWALKIGDRLEVHISDDEQEVVIRRYDVSTRRQVHEDSEGMA